MNEKDRPEKTTPQREQKHLQIDDRMDRLALSIARLDTLRAEIANEPTDERPKEPVSQNRSLVDVLSCLPDELVGAANKIEKITEAIRELIF